MLPNSQLLVAMVILILPNSQLLVAIVSLVLPNSQLLVANVVLVLLTHHFWWLCQALCYQLTISGGYGVPCSGLTPLVSIVIAQVAIAMSICNVILLISSQGLSCSWHLCMRSDVSFCLSLTIINHRTSPQSACQRGFPVPPHNSLHMEVASLV